MDHQCKHQYSNLWHQNHKTCSGLQNQRSAGGGYNLIDSVLLLYSSVVLIVGSSSWIHSASKVIRYPSPLEVEARISTLSSVKVVLHCCRWYRIGPCVFVCSVKRVCIMSACLPNIVHSKQLGHASLYTVTPSISIWTHLTLDGRRT